MGLTDAALVAELTEDPAEIGYDGMTTAEKLVAINAPREGVAIPQIVDVATILGVIAMAPFRVAAMSEPNRTAWLQVLANIRSLKEGMRTSDAPVQQLLAVGVSDGAITAEEKQILESLGQRPGSRAEQLWGEGASVTLNDLARVL